MRTLAMVEAAKAKSGTGGGGGGGGGGSSSGWKQSDSGAVDEILDNDYLGQYADYIEDNNLIAILGLDKDLASAIEEYDQFYSKLEDTRDSLEKLYQQVVSVWNELA